MKVFSIIFYTLGSILLVISCFVTSISLMWWLGGAAVLCLIIGCVCQYKARTLNG